MSADDEREALAQVIANSLWAMQSGYTPTEAWEIPTPNGGDDALAADILAAGFRRQGPITDAQADAANQAWHDYVWADAPPLSRRDLGITRQAWKAALEAARAAS
jgi:hypothetical protein